jgi:hypothetical protein
MHVFLEGRESIISSSNIEGKEAVVIVLRGEMQRIEREHKEIWNKEERIKFFESF